MNICTPRVFPTLLASLALLAGCGQQKGPDFRADVVRLNAELDAAQQKLSAVEKELAAKNDEIARAAADAFAAEATKKQSTETAQTVAQKEGQIRALQAEIAELKKRDVFAYADASAMQQKGLTSIALDRYQQFVKDNPKSALVADANRAIAELSVAADREAKWRASLIDPKRPEREVVKRFGDGVVTVEEIAPLLRDRTSAEVVKLLGKPNTTYRNGTEIGYVDKVLDPATGQKETLVIVFDTDFGRVARLRIGYRGREIKP